VNDATASIGERVASVHARISDAARRADRDPREITLVAITKAHPARVVAAVLAAGVIDLGENRAQELVAKAEATARSVPVPRWHMVGRLQRNKVKLLAPYVTLWHSVDRVELGPPLARHAPGARVLVEVDLVGEPQKGGCDPQAAPALVESLRAEGLDVAGMMTVPPRQGDPRPVFASLRELASGLGLGVLSMGMSDDFEVAIEEGATLVRVGTALFGARPDVATPG
jgi:pyridoxal phosphate enzyme (YggS family)